jgi:Putative flagellar system-associated repeat
MHLVPGLDPDPGAAPAPRPYHRLRLLFGLDAGITDSADDTAIVAERADIETLPAGEQPTAYLAAMRRYAARDSADLQPLTEVDTGNVLLFPAADSTPVVIASVTGITLKKQANAGWQLTAASASIDMRRTVIDTATIQELLSGPPLVTPAAGPTPGPGPTVKPDSVTIKGRIISFTVSEALNTNSVTKAAFKVTVLGAAGWTPIVIDSVAVDAATQMTVTLTLHVTPAGDALRLVAFGTGPNPIVGQAAGNHPLGGDPGFDFVHMIALSGGS